MAGNLRNTEPSVLRLRWQLVETAYHPRLLVARDDHRVGKYRYITGIRAAEIEAPYGLRGYARVRGDAEVGILPGAFHEVMLGRKLVEILEAIRPWPQDAVELSAPFKGQAGRGIDGIVRTYGGIGLQSGIGQSTLRQHRHNGQR